MTLFDTSVIIDARDPGSPFHEWSSRIPLGDFLIGAHAEAEGMPLVTRDPTRVSVYFPDVKLIQP